MKRIKNLLSLLLVFTLVASLSACRNESPSRPQNEADIQKEVNNDLFPLTINDFLDRESTIDKEPERIITLAPSVTELIFALGSGHKIVGVTDFDNYPSQVENIEKVGDFKGPNIEAIIAQKPDIIFASNLSGKDEMLHLEELGIPVIMIEAKNIEQIYESIELLSLIINAAEKGGEIITGIKTQIGNISNKVKDLPEIDVFFLVGFDGNWTAGKGTFIDELIDLAGGNNIASNVEGWAQYSMEELVEKNPNIIITSPHTGSIEDFKNTVGYKDLDAIKQDKVYTVSSDDIIARSSDRIVLGLKEIAEFLHPEVFK